jgi:ABC-2 type transport system ATP-binding protein
VTHPPPSSRSSRVDGAGAPEPVDGPRPAHGPEPSAAVAGGRFVPSANDRSQGARADEWTGPAIEVRDLVRRFGAIEAVRGVSFEVAPGETFGFLGPNGAGKSTTISMLCTLMRPTAGKARVAGFDVVDERAEVRKRIGLVFQDTTLDDYLTAEENLRFHAELYGVPRLQTGPRIADVLHMVGLFERRAGLVRTFSGGMKRRLEIARGLLHSPRVLFLDEPTVGLDPQTRAHIWEYINELRRSEAITMFLTTHYMDEAEHCDRIAIIDQGHIVVEDTPEALKASVGRDRVRITTGDDRAAIAALSERFDIEATMSEGTVAFYVAQGEVFVPQLFASLGVPISSVSIARPTLDDVFMNYTGRTIRDAEASGSERLAANPWIRARRR